LASLGIPPGPAAAQGAYAPLPVPQTPENDRSNDEPPLGWPQNPAFNPPGGVPGPPVQFGTPTTNANVQPAYGYTGTGALIENDIYYFHPDHLGSTSYLTNKQGNVSQHVEYIPFGEIMIETHLNNQNNPYLYNGKELDAEIGFYYYGARYYDPKGSLWLSVDPLAEKYPNLSPYSYVANNPIMLMDPTGMEGVPGPFTGNSYYQKNKVIINSLRMTSTGRYWTNIYQSIAFAGTGWIGTAFGVATEFKKPKEPEWVAELNRYLTTTLSASTELWDNFIKLKEISPYVGKEVKVASKAINSIVQWSSVLVAVSGSTAPTPLEFLEEMTFNLANKIIPGSSINIVNDGILQINNKNSSPKELDDQLNTIFAGLLATLNDFDLSSKKGQKKAREYINKNETRIIEFINMLKNTKKNSKE